MIRHNGPISGVACSPRYVATAGYDNQVILWDAKTKTALARGGHDHLANRCEISKDEKFLVSASSDYTARLFELPEMKLRAVLADHSDDVELARFSPCNEKVVTTSQDGKIRIFSFTGGLLQTFEGHSGAVSSCAWSADGNRIVSSGDDGTIRTWDVQEGRALDVFKPEAVQTDAVVLTSRGVAYAGNDCGELIRIEDGRMTRLKLHESGVKNVILSSDESLLATMSYDGFLALAKVTNTAVELIKRIRIPTQVWARAGAFFDLDQMVFGTFGSSYALLRLSTEEWDFSQVTSTNCLNAVLAFPDRLLAVGDAGEVRTCDRNSGQDDAQPREVIARTGSLCNFIVNYRDRVVCGGHLGQVFDAMTGEVLIALNTPINKAVVAGEYLALALYTGELAICRFDGQHTLSLVGRYQILKNAIKDICADDSLIFCAGAAADIATFDCSGFKRASYLENAHANIINSCLSLGSGRFATVSRDLKLNVWQGVAPLGSFTTPHNHSIKCASVTADKRYIATGSYDGKLAIFDTENESWPVFKKVTAAGLSSLVSEGQSFFASSYDGHIYELGAQ